MTTESDRHVNLNTLRDSIEVYVCGSVKQYEETGSPATPTAENFDSDLMKSFWHELKHGIYFLKVGSDLAPQSLQKAEQLVTSAIRQGMRFDLAFLQDLFLTLSPVNVRIRPAIRRDMLSKFNKGLAKAAPEKHPLRVICAELEHDNDSADVSEIAVDHMLEVIKNNMISHVYDDPPGLAERALMIECAAIALLRRDSQLERAATKANALLESKEFDHRIIHDECRDPAHLKPMRLAATELFHVRMDQRSMSGEAVALGLYVLTGIPCDMTILELPPTTSLLDQTLLIEDGKSVHALECLAKICEGCDDGYETGIEWLVMARELAIKRSYGQDDAVVDHIDEKIAQLRDKALGKGKGKGRADDLTIRGRKQSSA